MGPNWARDIDAMFIDVTVLRSHLQHTIQTVILAVDTTYPAQLKSSVKQPQNLRALWFYAV
jgi:hypothetical protein